MAGYEIIVKTEEMRRKVQEGDYSAALKILETIDLKKVKNMADFSLMAEVYMQNGRYEEAFELYLKVYHKTKTRKALFQLVYTSIKKNGIEEAEMYLREYEKAAPQDFYIHIFHYQIDKRKGEPYEVLINHLKTLKEMEYIEEWAYELAKLYYKAGMEEECIQECSDIILWFGEGNYVEKAKVLRTYYSGEADKDMIIEELKRRALQDTNRWDIREDFRDENDRNEEDHPADEERISDTNGNNSPDDDFMVMYTGDEAVDEVLKNMKKDVEEILSGEAGDNTKEDNHEEDPESGETAAPEAEQDSEEIAEDTYHPYDSYMEGDTYPEEGNLSDRETAEQEVEDELYRLLDEEDDDVKRLIEIAEEFDFDLYNVFGNFLHVKSVKKQLAKSLDLILDKHTKSVQMIITGTAGSGKTTLAKDISVFLNKTGKLKSSKIAKISAEKLNAVDIFAKKETLEDCCLVIENASDLKASTVTKLLDLIRYFHGDIAVIFEEDKKNMNKLFRVCPKLMDLFKNRIHLPQYTDEEMLSFAFAYIKLRDYRLQKGAETALRNMVYKILKESEPEKQLNLIQKMIQAAMTSADVRTGKQLPSLAAQGKLGDVEVLTILPEDFTALV